MKRLQNNNIIIMLAVLLLSSCASESMLQRSDRYAKYTDPMKAVIELRKEIQSRPDNVQLRSLLKQYEFKTAEIYYHKGLVKYNNGDFGSAIALYEQGLIAMPEHEKLAQSMFLARTRMEVLSVYNEAVQNYKAGKYKDTELMLLKIIEQVPDFSEAKKLLAELRVQGKLNNPQADFFTDQQKISLNFRNTDIKTAFGFLAKSYGINIIFDEGVKSKSITLSTKDVSLKQALDLMLSSSNTFYKKIGNNTMLIAQNTKTKREQYDELFIKTYHLRTIPAKQMSEIIKGVLKVKKVVLNESMNSMMIRESRTMHGLIDKMVELNDRRPAEILLEVEILEVNRNKAEQLGLDYGSLITTEFPDVAPGVNTFATALASGTTTLPNVTFRYFKQDVDAETLANPKIRVMNQKPAKIHIGDRVPLRAATIQNPTGGTQTSYEYTDIGIRLDVDPVIHFDNSVTVKLNLEVSSLGQNLGTPEEPTYSIGTRTTQTHMLLRDGETAVIGGLIRDEDRSNQVRVPGFGDIPGIGSLFKSNDDSNGRTDVLLTITPKVVRSWDIPRESLHSISSGTESGFSDDAGTIARPSKVNLASQKAATGSRGGQPSADMRTAPSGYILSFDKDLYAHNNGEDIQVKVSLNSSKGLDEIAIPILFNPALLEFIELEPTSDKVADLQKLPTENGVTIKLQLKPGQEVAENETLFTLSLRGRQVGISYLSIKQSQWQSHEGGSGTLETRAARIVIK